MAPTSSRICFAVSSLVLVGLALWLRVDSSQLRLFHADEGVQAYQAWKLIETGEYRYDPSEHHGPLLYQITKWVAPLLEDNQGELSDAGMRRVPLFFSILGLGFGLFVFSRRRWIEGIVWAAIVATAPLCIIYGSYYIQEALLTCFTLMFLVACCWYFESPGYGKAVVAAIALGLMHVTKETAVLHGIVVLISTVVVFRLRCGKSILDTGEFWKHLVLATFVVVVFHCLFFSSFLKNPQGILDGFAAFFNYAERSQGQGHEKPFLYYLKLLLPQTLEGVRWGETGFISLTILGVIRLFRRKKEPALPYILTLSGFGLLLVYSVIPYKNPWLLLTPYCLIAYCSACGVVALFRISRYFDSRSWQWSSVIVVLGFCVFLGKQQMDLLENAIYRNASASRNPYLYMHTTPRYAKLIDRIESAGSSVDVGVYSPDAAWPLPWHLRQLKHVGYWSNLDDYVKGGIDLIDTRLLVNENELMNQGGFWELHGLRPNTLLALRAGDGIAEKWVENHAEN